MLVSLNFEFNHILILIASIAAVIHSYNDEKYSKNKNDKSEKIFQCFLASLGQSISIILYYIERYFSKSELTLSDSTQLLKHKKRKELKKKNQKGNKIKIYKLFIFLIISDLISWYFFVEEIFNYVNLGWPLIILFIYQKILLKVSLYKHHYLSIINIFLSFILFIIFLMHNQKYFQFFFFSLHFN